MFRYDAIREGDIAALLRLVGEVTELPATSSYAARTHVLHALLSLIGGRSAVVMDMAPRGLAIWECDRFAEDC